MGGGKERSSSLGRALVRQHNQMVQQSKEKGATLHKLQRKQQQTVLESYTEVKDLEAVLEQVEEAGWIHSMANPTPSLCIDLDEKMVGNGERQRQEVEALYASSLRVPRRPYWNVDMSVEELDATEKQAFVAWRRSLARIEENENLILTPFEKNLDIWRQLWRVLERSNLIVMVVDARNPLFYRCPDLEAYALEIDEGKKTLLLVNKADLLPLGLRKQWAKYFQRKGILFVFWSAKAAAAAPQEDKQLSSPGEETACCKESLSVDDDKDVEIYTRNELLARLQAEAEAIVDRKDSSKNVIREDNHYPDVGERTRKQVVVGFVGYPNVGKSSTINALVGAKRTGVTSTPGKTKHFQTLIISDTLILCDCPGLVFPSFSSSRSEMIASGVLPVDKMTKHREAVQVVVNKVPRHVLEGVYNIKLPNPKPYESQTRPPLASEFLRTFCSSRGYVASSGLPDETRATRLILKDYIDGKIPHFEVPPASPEVTCERLELNALDGSPSIDSFDSQQPDSCDSDNDSSVGDENNSRKPNIDLLLNDLESFDMNSGLTPSAIAKKKKVAASTHKHHKKPQRKKDRSWRVGNDGGDGMPVIRVFQKPAVTQGTSEGTTSMDYNNRR